MHDGTPSGPQRVTPARRGVGAWTEAEGVGGGGGRGGAEETVRGVGSQSLGC